MNDDETTEFRIGPDFLNEVLRQAEVKEIAMSTTADGQLHLDTELSGEETINRLITGMAMLYSKLVQARQGKA